MNVYDTANRLAREIQESDEYKEYKKTKEAVMSNPDSKQKVEDFEKLRYDVQLMQYTGEGKDERKYYPFGLSEREYQRTSFAVLCG